jgi:hypothetical protein
VTEVHDNFSRMIFFDMTQHKGIHGCKLGARSKEDKLTTEDYEMLVIANKS